MHASIHPSKPGASILGVGGRDPQILGRAALGGHGRMVKYSSLSCTGSMFESGDFWREIE